MNKTASKAAVKHLKMSPAPDTVWLTLKEAATYLRVSKRTVRRFIKRGQLIAMKLGRELRFTRQMLDSALTPVEVPANQIAQTMAGFINATLVPDDHR